MFPLGIYPYLVGGVFIGLAVAMVYILVGIHATQSSLFSAVMSYFSDTPYFQRESYLKSREWRVYFAVGVVLGALIYTITLSTDGFFNSALSLWRIVLGGFLVGFGTRLSSGCTSGHGISGLASLSLTSLYAVITFLGVGIITANIIHILGVPL
jgi:uncharacterized membrane protein YedE/YeeE